MRAKWDGNRANEAGNPSADWHTWCGDKKCKQEAYYRRTWKDLQGMLLRRYVRYRALLMVCYYLG